MSRGLATSHQLAYHRTQLDFSNRFPLDTLKGDIWHQSAVVLSLPEYTFAPTFICGFVIYQGQKTVMSSEHQLLSLDVHFNCRYSSNMMANCTSTCDVLMMMNQREMMSDLSHLEMPSFSWSLRGLSRLILWLLVRHPKRCHFIKQVFKP